MLVVLYVGCVVCWLCCVLVVLRVGYVVVFFCVVCWLCCSVLLCSVVLCVVLLLWLCYCCVVLVLLCVIFSSRTIFISHEVVICKKSNSK